MPKSNKAQKAASCKDESTSLAKEVDSTMKNIKTMDIFNYLLIMSVHRRIENCTPYIPAPIVEKILDEAPKYGASAEKLTNSFTLLSKLKSIPMRIKRMSNLYSEVFNKAPYGMVVEYTTVNTRAAEVIDEIGRMISLLRDSDGTLPSLYKELPKEYRNVDTYFRLIFADIISAMVTYKKLAIKIIFTNPVGYRIAIDEMQRLFYILKNKDPIGIYKIWDSVSVSNTTSTIYSAYPAQFTEEAFPSSKHSPHTIENYTTENYTGGGRVAGNSELDKNVKLLKLNEFNKLEETDKPEEVTEDVPHNILSVYCMYVGA